MNAFLHACRYISLFFFLFYTLFIRNDKVRSTKLENHDPSFVRITFSTHQKDYIKWNVEFRDVQGKGT
jgi:hypothetical protein